MQKGVIFVNDSVNEAIKEINTIIHKVKNQLREKYNDEEVFTVKTHIPINSMSIEGSNDYSYYFNVEIFNEGEQYKAKSVDPKEAKDDLECQIYKEIEKVILINRKNVN